MTIVNSQDKLGYSTEYPSLFIYNLTKIAVH